MSLAEMVLQQMDDYVKDKTTGLPLFHLLD